MGYTTDFNPYPETYNNYDLNALRGDICTKGVIRDDTTNNMLVVSVNSTTVRILSGYALFEDGAKVKVDSEGTTVAKETSGRHYIYCKRTATGADFHAGISAPTGNYVLLAEVTGTTVTDKREYSAFKITRGLGNGYFVKKNISINYIVTDTWTKVHEEDVGTDLFRFAQIIQSHSYPTSSNYFFGHFDFDDNVLFGYIKASSTWVGNGDFSTGIRFTSSSADFMRLSYNGTKIEFWTFRTAVPGTSGTVNLDLMCS